MCEECNVVELNDVNVVVVELVEVYATLGCCCVFFFQAEDGIRDAQESRGLGDVYKRQVGRCANLCLSLL